jgi:hypothetical protein
MHPRFTACDWMLLLLLLLYVTGCQHWAVQHASAAAQQAERERPRHADCKQGGQHRLRPAARDRCCAQLRARDLQGRESLLCFLTLAYLQRGTRLLCVVLLSPASSLCCTAQLCIRQLGMTRMVAAAYSDIEQHA